MTKIFIDTNVILDFVLCRDGEKNALKVFQLGENENIDLVVSFLTMANVAYVARKHRSKEELLIYLNEFSSLFHILNMDECQFNAALNTIAPDFEDSLQYQCAKLHNCDFIVTNNTKHFPFKDINVTTPHQLLTILNHIS